MSATFSEPDWGGLEEIECDVILLADRCEVVPAGHRLTVPRLGASSSIEFRVRPQVVGSILLRFRIYLASGSLLLQELVTSVDTVAESAKVSS